MRLSTPSEKASSGNRFSRAGRHSGRFMAALEVRPPLGSTRESARGPPRLREEGACNEPARTLPEEPASGDANRLLYLNISSIDLASALPGSSSRAFWNAALALSLFPKLT